MALRDKKQGSLIKFPGQNLLLRIKTDSKSFTPEARVSQAVPPHRCYGQALAFYLAPAPGKLSSLASLCLSHTLALLAGQQLFPGSCPNPAGPIWQPQFISGTSQAMDDYPCPSFCFLLLFVLFCMSLYVLFVCFRLLDFSPALKIESRTLYLLCLHLATDLYLQPPSPTRNPVQPCLSAPHAPERKVS